MERKLPSANAVLDKIRAERAEIMRERADKNLNIWTGEEIQEEDK